MIGVSPVYRAYLRVSQTIMRTIWESIVLRSILIGVDTYLVLWMLGVS